MHHHHHPQHWDSFEVLNSHLIYVSLTLINCTRQSKPHAAFYLSPTFELKTARLDLQKRPSWEEEGLAVQCMTPFHNSFFWSEEKETWSFLEARIVLVYDQSFKIDFRQKYSVRLKIQFGQFGRKIGWSKISWKIFSAFLRNIFFLIKSSFTYFYS